MGKSFYEGLKYIRLEVDIHNNEKVEKMEARHGDAGFAFMIKLWLRVYSDSYYLELDDDIIRSFCRKSLNKPVEEFNEMLKSAIEFNIFDHKLFEAYRILTSAGMQRRYLHITKRWGKVLWVKEYACRKVDITPYHIFITNRAGEVQEERWPKEIPGAKHKVAAVKKEIPQVKPEPINGSHQPTGGFLQAPKILNVGKVLTNEIQEFCAKDYETQNDKFKSVVNQDWFLAYVALNRFIDEEYTQIRISEYQLTYDKFYKLLSEPLNGKMVTIDELRKAIERLAGNGVKPDFSMFLKLKDYVGYVREPKNNSKKRNEYTTTFQTSKPRFGKL